jgi:chlorobactene glucosyltransferase
LLFVDLAATVASLLILVAVRIGLWRRQAPRLSTVGAVGTIGGEGAARAAGAAGKPGAASGEGAAAAAGVAEADLPACTILLPVRNEEVNLAECVASLAAQTVPARVLIVDDNSEDRTGEMARRLAAGSERVSTIAAGALRAGWKGKVHALDVGQRQVATPWTLTTDADTRHAPELLARALATARERGLDALSLAGFQEVVGLGEGLFTPLVFAVLDGLLGDWRRVAGGEAEVANGQFVLVRRAALEAVGGFASVRTEALDDVALARRLRRAGFRHAFFRAPDLLRIRMYRGFAGTFRGWRRNLGAIFAGRPALALAVMALLLAPAALLLLGLLGLLGVVAAAAGAGGAAAAGTGSGGLGGAGGIGGTTGIAAIAGCLILWACGSLASMMVRAGSGHFVPAGLLYPLDALIVAACIAAGLADVSRGKLATWKGRAIDLG